MNIVRSPIYCSTLFIFDSRCHTGYVLTFQYTEIGGDRPTPEYNTIGRIAKTWPTSCMTPTHVTLICFRLEVGLVLPHPAFHHFDEGAPDSSVLVHFSSSSSPISSVKRAGAGTYTPISENIYHLRFGHNALPAINIRCNRSFTDFSSKTSSITDTTPTEVLHLCYFASRFCCFIRRTILF